MVAIAEAQGRLDLFGGGPTGAWVHGGVPLRAVARVRLLDEPAFVAAGRSGAGRPRAEVRVPREVLVPADGPPSYERARSVLAGVAGDGWAWRALGAIPLLARERRIVIDRGAAVSLEGDPELPAILGHPAAVEVASLRAILRAYGGSLPEAELVRLAVRVATLIGGSPTPVADVWSAVRGKEGHLLVGGGPDGTPRAMPLPDAVDLLAIDPGPPARPDRSVEATPARGAGDGARFVAALDAEDFAAMGRLLSSSDEARATRAAAVVDGLLALGGGVLGAKGAGGSGAGPVVVLTTRVGIEAVKAWVADHPPHRVLCSSRSRRP